jgi:hypothetical protein
MKPLSAPIGNVGYHTFSIPVGASGAFGAESSPIFTTGTYFQEPTFFNFQINTTSAGELITVKIRFYFSNGTNTDYPATPWKFSVALAGSLTNSAVMPLLDGTFAQRIDASGNIKKYITKITAFAMSSIASPTTTFVFLDIGTVVQ